MSPDICQIPLQICITEVKNISSVFSGQQFLSRIYNNVVYFYATLYDLHVINFTMVRC